MTGWFNLASSLFIVARAVARAVGTAGAKAIASMTSATADIVAAIFLNMHPPRLAQTILRIPLTVDWTFGTVDCAMEAEGYTLV